MAFELLLLTQRGQQSDRDQAAGFELQPGALPHIAPRCASNVFLHRGSKGCRTPESRIHKRIAHHLSAGGKALGKCLGTVALGKAGGGCCHAGKLLRCLP